MSIDWKNRIISYGSKPASQFAANPRNFRTHPAAQRQAVQASLDTLGWIDVVIENAQTGFLVDGHERIWDALKNNDAEVPFIQVDLSEEEEAQALLSIDPIAAMAASDRDKLDTLLRQVQSDDERVQALMAEIAEREGLDYGVQETDTDDPPVPTPDRFEEVAQKWGTADGQLWQLGNHFVLCADSLGAENVKRLTGDMLPALVIADPPYGVNIVGEAYNIPFGGRKNGGLRGSVGSAKPFGSKAVRGTDSSAHLVDTGKYPVIIGDETTDTAEQAVVLYCEMFPKAVQVWWGANYYSPILPASQCWLVWNKETTGGFADCELAWTNQDKAAKLFTHKWNGMLRDSERERRWHPTQKPAALAAWVYSEFTESGAAILDPFAGAGWSVLAGETVGRRVFAIEKSHEYVAVICERWAQMTGRQPVLVE